METIEGRIVELKIKGYCCSQLVAAIVGLDPLGEENEMLLTALRGLCIGMYASRACGALTGAACALSLYMSGNGLKESCGELVEWFETRFGGPDCKDLIGLGGVPAQVCMDAVKEVCEKCFEILTERGCL